MPATISTIAVATAIQRNRMQAATIARIIARASRRSSLSLSHAELCAPKLRDADGDDVLARSYAGGGKNVVVVHEVDGNTLTQEGAGSRTDIDPRFSLGIVDHRRVKYGETPPDVFSVMRGVDLFDRRCLDIDVRHRGFGEDQGLGVRTRRVFNLDGFVAFDFALLAKTCHVRRQEQSCRKQQSCNGPNFCALHDFHSGNGSGSALCFIFAQITGRMRSVSSVEVTRPPRATAANACKISNPAMFPATTRGRRAPAVTTADIRIGGARPPAARRMRVALGVIGSSAARDWKWRSNAMSLRMERANTTRSPARAARDIVLPPRAATKRPPTSAAGRVTKTTSAKRQLERAACNNKKMRAAAAISGPITRHRAAPQVPPPPWISK